MGREKPSDLDEKEWNILSDLIGSHSRGAGLYGECYIGNVITPQDSKETLYTRRLFLKGYLRIFNPSLESNPQNWSPKYILSNETEKQFKLFPHSRKK